MKSVIPLAVLAAMGALVLISWKNVGDVRTQDARDFQQYMKKGEAFEEKKIYIDAVKQYESALKIEPQNYELAMRITDLYEKLEDDKSYISACQKAIKSDPSQAAPYIMAVERCSALGDNKQAAALLKKADENLKDSQNVAPEEQAKLDALKLEVYGDCRTSKINVEAFYGFHQIDGKGTSAALVQREGKFGIISNTGSNLTDTVYDEINLPANGLIAVMKDGERYFETSKGGYRKVVPDDKAEALGIFSGTYAPIKVGGKYGYINQKMNQVHFDYEYAGGFEKGAAIVKKDGKWGIIGTDFAMNVPAEFDEIKMDYYGFGLTYGVFFGRKGSTWGLYDLTGSQLADGFEDVRLFASDQPAAFKKDGRWGFVDKTGKIVIDPQYDDADSFSCGYAPVKQLGKWGCINRDALLVIAAEYDQLSAFNESGYAFCQQGDDTMFLIVKVYATKE